MKGQLFISPSQKVIKQEIISVIKDEIARILINQFLQQTQPSYKFTIAWYGESASINALFEVGAAIDILNYNV